MGTFTLWRTYDSSHVQLCHNVCLFVKMLCSYLVMLEESKLSIVILVTPIQFNSIQFNSIHTHIHIDLNNDVQKERLSLHTAVLYNAGGGGGWMTLTQCALRRIEWVATEGWFFCVALNECSWRHTWSDPNSVCECVRPSVKVLVNLFQIAPVRTGSLQL